jgi:hypothetical protein
VYAVDEEEEEEGMAAAAWRRRLLKRMGSGGSFKCRRTPLKRRLKIIAAAAVVGS